MACTCSSTTEGETSELDAAVAAVIAAADEKMTAALARIDQLEATIAAGAAPAEDPEVEGEDGEPITAASTEDTADSRVRELEVRVAQLEEAVSAIIVDTTPDMEGMVTY